MSAAARVGIVLVLLVGAGLFAGALVQAPQGIAEAQAPADEAEEAVPIGPPAQPGVLESSESCRECHPEIYAEWQEDRHSQAWVGELFTELSKGRTDANCWSCHAPRPILQTGLNSPAEARADDRESGINCLTCHVNRERTHVVGPIREPQATPECETACGPLFDPRYPTGTAQEATVAFCGVCHNLHGTHTEFLGSEYARGGMTCLSCHMTEVVGPVAKGGPPRARRIHRLPGGHSPEMLRTAMTIEPHVEGERLVVRTVNRGAGHRVPTDARHRAIYVRVAFFDPYGQPVIAEGLEGERGREVAIDLIRLFYRHEQRDPTQIDPAGTLGRDNWRDSSVEIPARARGGHAVVRLYYFLRIGLPAHKGTLVEDRKVPLG